MSFPFTLTIDWLAFTLPSGSVEDTMHILGGDWTKSEVGFRGYPLSWLSAGAGRGVGKLGTGALRAPREVHVDLSAWIVASWPLEKVRTIMQWVLKGEGHLTRLDCALDDRNSSVPLSTIRHASEAGQCVTLADRMQRILSGSIHKGTPSGETLYLGSPHSQTLLRIYDKRLELQFKEREDWQEYGIRWELELKRIGPRCVDRSSLFWRKPTGLNLWSGSFGPMSIFEKPFEMRGRVSVSGPAPRLVAAAHRRVQERRLVVEKDAQTLPKIKRWVSQRVAPMLAVICAADPGGHAWLENQTVVGKRQWKGTHRGLLKKENPSSSKQDAGGDAGAPFQGGEGGVVRLPLLRIWT